ncbi:cytochrome c biogenesis protein CcdA [Aliiroseovarius crassostreae]|uniref:Cytochrome c biogenesis protein CcdA n=1 Tax=Aliiroseovarius crassostreae TaxID=154981 RepID=A0A9Q9HCL3_9RHOB|nr:cytochrome c biogenesis protein CcdA [Aliiroseovarius crassostreae]UWP90454.1 cytochrome c biogenesis protein CcdA [Aliiroseovarius crassostreae]UWP93599.1 cytochrome c biogenesis protein CcdA [Aliiroseovarius crassostreae]UWP96786.1 cytochrome c biogenesis protein CcdA [Aliiroseovarius crassostreae]UWQ03119.1 cytochrome c biogenesis protein CcdA [Aliiroseovarius crassostreae]
MLEISFAGAALAGLLSFASPCILPMVPFYLSYLAGLSMSELQDEGGIAPGAQRRLILAALAFALGVTSIFVLLGLGATALGTAFAQYKPVLAYVGAALLVVFGLHFLGIWRIGFLYREARLDSGADPSSIMGAYLMGLAFGFGWTPCVGPVLASILMIASGMGDLTRGAALLAVYGVGMTAPFVLAAFFAKGFIRWAARHRKYLPVMEKVMGGMLILFAVLIASGQVNVIGQWLIDWFPALTRLG